jgi:mono/diheme cytochrome c family protein
MDYMNAVRPMKFLGVMCAAAALALIAAIGLRAAPAATVPPPAALAAPAAPAATFRHLPPPAQPDPVALYRANCQMCHGIKGKAAIEEMAFFEREWKHGTSSVQIAKIITEGVKGTPMMPFKSKLKPEEITALAKYVRSLDPKLPPEKQ